MRSKLIVLEDLRLDESTLHSATLQEILTSKTSIKPPVHHVETFPKVTTAGELAGGGGVVVLTSRNPLSVPLQEDGELDEASFVSSCKTTEQLSPTILTPSSEFHVHRRKVDLASPAG